MAINPLKRTMISFLTDAACKEIECLDAQSPCQAELSEHQQAGDVIRRDIEKICNCAALSEMAKIFALVTRLQHLSEREQEAARVRLKKIAENLMARAENKSGPLDLPQTCHYLLCNL